jgi:VanZ family protein
MFLPLREARLAASHRIFCTRSTLMRAEGSNPFISVAPSLLPGYPCRWNQCFSANCNHMTKPELTRRLWLAVGYIGFAIIVMLSLAPAASRPHSGYGGEYEHLLAYALVGLAFGMGYRTARPQVFSAVALSSAAGILELLQTFVPGRNADITGFLTSCLGAWLGLAAAAVLCVRK